MSKCGLEVTGLAPLEPGRSCLSHTSEAAADVGQGAGVEDAAVLDALPHFPACLATPELVSGQVGRRHPPSCSPLPISLALTE